MATSQPKRFTTAAAFKASLEDRLKRAAADRGVPMNTLRLKFVMERLLARLFAVADPPWLLKGGYAMELRYRPRARTTRDLDLSVANPAMAATLAARLTSIREELQAAAAVDPGDYLRYTIAAPLTELQGAPLGGARFPCEVTLAGKLYGRFHLDLGFGDASTGVPERLTGDSLLEFAGIPPAVVLAIPKAQQFAEKAHAYTYPWMDRINTRTKDLVDLVLFVQSGELSDVAELRAALAATFGRRNTHALPDQFPPPPPAWERDYATMAAEAQLSSVRLTDGFEQVSAFWRDSALGSPVRDPNADF
jgi:hypothetical protein